MQGNWNLNGIHCTPITPVGWQQRRDTDTLTLYVGDLGIYEFDFAPAYTNRHPLVRLVKVSRDETPARGTEEMQDVEKMHDDVLVRPDSPAYAHGDLATAFQGWDSLNRRFTNQAAHDVAYAEFLGQLPAEASSAGSRKGCNDASCARHFAGDRSVPCILQSIIDRI